VKYAEFIQIIEAHGFKIDRQNGSHRIYEGFVDGRRCAVTVAYHRVNDEILPKNFASMIRQSGLGKKLFRR
jgi:predicted RNA binding protein YcfA (HicA-like mRNA interferase family)